MCYQFPDLVPLDGGKSNSKQSSFESSILNGRYRMGQRHRERAEEE